MGKSRGCALRSLSLARKEKHKVLYKEITTRIRGTWEGKLFVLMRLGEGHLFFLITNDLRMNAWTTLRYWNNWWRSRRRTKDWDRFLGFMGFSAGLKRDGNKNSVLLLATSRFLTKATALSSFCLSDSMRFVERVLRI
ncbi:MAG: hypothetical protein ACTSXX_08390 [Candidatus Baldrarchaeia archaeon]